MSDASDLSSEEERSLFRPFTRESLATIEARIAEEYAKQKELEKKRAEGEVPKPSNFYHELIFTSHEIIGDRVAYLIHLSSMYIYIYIISVSVFSTTLMYVSMHDFNVLIYC